MKKAIGNAAIVLLSLAIGLIALEGALRLLPVNEGLRAQPVNAGQPIFRFEANREAVFSTDWNFALRNSVRTNNYGFVADYDYDPASRSPLLAIVGDSYVEALMVPFPKTLTGRLHAKIGDGGRVYDFAASGAGLSQYLAWARFAREEFRPDGFAFVIVGNDFEDALASRGRSPGFHRFAPGADGGWRLVLSEYAPGLLRRVVRQSALARYLVMNLKLQAKLKMPFTLDAEDPEPRYVGNVAAAASDAFWREAVWAVEVFLDHLPAEAGVKADRIAFLIDGVRPQLYEPTGMEAVKESFWARMRTHFAIAAKKRGYEVIDLQPIFVARHLETGERFEYATDTHWNDRGHAIAAGALGASKTWQAVFPP